MKQALQQELFDLAPEWFQRDNPKQSLMYFGFEVCDGWFDLLKNLILDIKAAGVPEDFQVVQVKEKFGGLRFYVSPYIPEIEELITKAENATEETCELCGSPGKVRNPRGWVTVRCEACIKELN